MKLRAMVTSVKQQQAQSKTGAPVVYRDVHLADVEPDPLSRYTGEIILRPNDSEWSLQPLTRGEVYDVQILQCVDFRAGNVVVRANLSPLPKSK